MSVPLLGRLVQLAAVGALAWCCVVAGTHLFNVVSESRSLSANANHFVAGQILIEYMESHDGRWPAHWTDVDDFLSEPRDSDFPTNSADLQRFLRIDFSFDPKSEHAASGILSGTGKPVAFLNGEACESNFDGSLLIADYLKNLHREQ